MRAFSLLFLSLVSAGATAQPLRKPKLIVNIVVSQLRYDYLLRYSENLSEGGFRRFMREGSDFTEARYNYMQTNTPAGLATLTTGANPAIHGVVSDQWIDYVTNKPVYLGEDSRVRGVGAELGYGSYSPNGLIAPTLGEQLLKESPKSRVITVAAHPVSAVVMGGRTQEVYWMDTSQGTWVSSTAYIGTLPRWVADYNRMGPSNDYVNYTWHPLHSLDRYRNRNFSIMSVEAPRFLKQEIGAVRRQQMERGPYTSMLYMPPGISLVKNFAKQVLIYERLGLDGHPDILNVCFDTSRYVDQFFGGESMEYEDFFYRLDLELAEFTDFLFAQVPRSEVLLVLTSDHGASEPYDRGDKENERFSGTQFRLIMNGFLNAQYDTGDWVIAYRDRQLFLNRTLIYNSKLSLEEIQNRAADFARQFQGVSHVLTSSALNSTYFSGGYAEKMQNSFYPKRSGDLILNLMPGWIEEDEAIRSMSGSLYGYDTHVPLLWLGLQIPAQRVRTPVDMQDVAPTLAHILGINRPEGATGAPIEKIVSYFE